MCSVRKAGLKSVKSNQRTGSGTKTRESICEGMANCSRLLDVRNLLITIFTSHFSNLFYMRDLAGSVAIGLTRSPSI